MGSNDLYLLREGVSVRATIEQVRELEPAAAWPAAHVERRLQDHFAGRRNAAVELLKEIKFYGPDGRETGSLDR